MKVLFQIIIFTLLFSGCGIKKRVELYSFLDSQEKNTEFWEKVSNNDCEQDLLRLIAEYRIIEDKFPTKIEEIEALDYKSILEKLNNDEKVAIQDEIEKIKKVVNDCQQTFSIIHLNHHNSDTIQVNFIGYENIQECKKIEYTKNWQIVIENCIDYEIINFNFKMQLFDINGKVLLSDEDFNKFFR